MRKLSGRGTDGGLRQGLRDRDARFHGPVVDRHPLLAAAPHRQDGHSDQADQKDSAEDLAQEVLLVLHEKYGALERIEDLLPLSLEIARFKMLGARRKIVRRGEHTQVSVDDLPLAGSGPDPDASDHL